MNHNFSSPDAYEQDGFRFRGLRGGESWQESTVRRFETRDASIFVSREVLPSRQTLRSFIANKLISVCKAPDFDLIESREVEAGGLHGIRTHFTWQAAEDRHHQLLVWLEAQGGAVLTFSLTFVSTSEQARQKIWLSTFDQMVASTEVVHAPPRCRGDIDK